MTNRRMDDMQSKPLICPKDGQPIDQKYIGKWSDQLWLAYCHCGKVHELEPTIARTTDK